MLEKSIVILKYIKEAKFESKLFKVCEVQTNEVLFNEFTKTWDNERFVYLKNKYLKQELESLSYYKTKIKMDSFTNNLGETIKFICYVKCKPMSEYVEVSKLDQESDSDF